MTEKDVNGNSDLQTATMGRESHCRRYKYQYGRNKVLSYFRRIQHCLLYLLI